MDFSLPEFPATPMAQSAFVSAVLLLLFGLILVAIPSNTGRLLGLTSRETRLGAIGELRVTGGFLAGLSLATLLFDQPSIYVAFGTAMALAAFGRLLSMMSDQAAGLFSFLLLLVQAALAASLLTYLFDVWTPESAFVMPEEFNAKMVFSIYGLLAVSGFLIMFAPRIAMALAGLGIASTSEIPVASVRSHGGFLLGASLASMLIASPMLDFAMAAALLMSSAGRLLALATAPGNRIFNMIMLLVQLACGLFLLATVFGWV